MTTTVYIATQGNKAVLLTTPNGNIVLNPGHFLSLGIHGEQFLAIKETDAPVKQDVSYYFLPTTPEAAATPEGGAQ